MWSPIIDRLKPLYEENSNKKEKLDKAIQKLCEIITLCRNEGMTIEEIKDKILDKINFTHEDISRLERRSYQEAFEHSDTQQQIHILSERIEKIEAILNEGN